jgi:hypothetical protein
VPRRQGFLTGGTIEHALIAPQVGRADVVIDREFRLRS